MSKVLLLFLAIIAGGYGFTTLHRNGERMRLTAATQIQEKVTASNRLASVAAVLDSLRNEVQDKKKNLRKTSMQPPVRPELLLLLEGGKISPAVWFELRQQLGIGWDSSPEYVLVSKEVVKQLNFDRLQRFYSNDRPTDTACALLAISPEEQTRLVASIQNARDPQWLKLERGKPGGDIVAQFTILAPDPALELSVSNRFSTEIKAVLGEERGELFLPQAWRELRRELGPMQLETMTLRRVVVNGEPDLVYEITSGNSSRQDPVRYAHIPWSWFHTLFPGGWEALAKREGFELPRSFKP